MAYRIFAAIDVGSYEIEMKVFELSKSKGIREIDCIGHRLELGKEVYAAGKISAEKVENLCVVLHSFKEIMNGYQVDAYRACATSAIRETKNSMILRDYIEKKTGIKIEVLNNSEQRFLDYKSIASNENEFNQIIQKGTAIIDIGGGSVQFSLFDRGSLITTQNIRIGNLRIRERLAGIERNSANTEQLFEELINNGLVSFKKMYLKEREIKNLIIVGDEIREFIGTSAVSREQFVQFYDQIVHCTIDEVEEKFDVSAEQIQLLIPSLVIHRRFIEEFDIEMIWMPGLSLSDGMAYEYAQDNKLIKAGHDFDEDIISAARNIAKHYLCSKVHIKTVEELALTIFDKTRKLHGMDRRGRLLLQIAVILHGCGKYINLSDIAECSYNIIRDIELIGLSQAEKEVVANIVRYNTQTFDYYEPISAREPVTRENYLKIAKLTAILRVANALDRSHKQKFKNAKVTLKDDNLIIMADTKEDITLEQGLFTDKADFFEEVYGVRPVVRKKRIL